MFELLSSDRSGVPRRGALPMLISTIAHVVVVGALSALSVLYVSSELPEVPDMLAFVVSAAPPPPPPPPAPPPQPAATAPKPTVIKPVQRAPRPVPMIAPVDISEEPEFVDTGNEEGVPGGIEGGVPGGVIGGIIGGVTPTGVLPPPPPPSPPVVERGPVRVGGAITAPALIERVEPVYPPLAVSAKVQGVVILEATVGRDGRVEDVHVLRSIPLLDAAAVRAVRHWRYSPLLLNGKPERFVLTVTVSFSLA